MLLHRPPRPVLRLVATMILLLTASSAVLTQETAPAIDRRNVRAVDDVRLARRALEMIHPGYDRYTSRPILDAAFDRLEKRSASGIDERALFVELSRVAALIRCSHTKVEPSEKLERQQREMRSLLPFRFDSRHGGVIVTLSASQDLARGDEVLSIDGRSTAEILAEVESLTSADGWTDGSRRFAAGGMSDLASCELDLFLPCLMPIGETADLEVRAPGAGSSRRVVVPFLTSADRAARLSDEVSDNLDESITLAFPRSDVAVLSIGTFVAYRKKLTPAEIYRPYFEKICASAAKTLILDLRQNGGGSDSAVVDLMRLLGDGAYTSRGRTWVKTYRFGDLAEKLETWDRSLLSMPDDAFRKLDNGYFEVIRDETRYEPLEPRFEGRIIVLAGPANQSGAALAVERLRRERGATVVGEETGGRPPA